MLKIQKFRIRLAAAMGFLAVTLGAFGAHGLDGTLKELGTRAIWETAVFYHFIHTVMLFLMADRDPARRGPWYSFLIGIVLFSGSLYILAVTGIKWLGAITPFGGVAFLIGWGLLIYRPFGKIKIKIEKKKPTRIEIEDEE